MAKIPILCPPLSQTRKMAVFRPFLPFFGPFLVFFGLEKAAEGIWVPILAFGAMILRFGGFR